MGQWPEGGMPLCSQIPATSSLQNVPSSGSPSPPVWFALEILLPAPLSPLISSLLPPPPGRIPPTKGICVQDAGGAVGGRPPISRKPGPRETGGKWTRGPSWEARSPSREAALAGPLLWFIRLLGGST